MKKNRKVQKVNSNLRAFRKARGVNKHGKRGATHTQPRF